VLNRHATLTMSVTRRIRERRWGTGRDGASPAGVDQQGSRRRRVSREGTREAVRSISAILQAIRQIERRSHGSSDHIRGCVGAGRVAAPTDSDTLPGAKCSSAIADRWLDGNVARAETRPDRGGAT